jgi:hypothetical protein
MPMVMEPVIDDADREEYRIIGSNQLQITQL